MNKTLSIRWHSRAGQGAITASTALAEILGETGKFVQSFPDFGAEKRGAPVAAFNRISEERNRNVAHPSNIDLVVLLDTTLISSGEITVDQALNGLNKNGKLLINTTQNSLELDESSKETFGIDASKIALEEIGKNIPNVAILGALIKILDLAKLEDFLPKLEIYLSKGLPAEIVKGNLKAFERGYNEVQKIEGGSKEKNSKDCKKLPGWKEIKPGAVIDKPGSSEKYNTGNWVQQSCSWDPKTCINCNLCWPVCPHDAIKQDKNGNMIGVDEDKCTACGLCVVACPTNPKSLEIVEKKKKEI